MGLSSHYVITLFDIFLMFDIFMYDECYSTRSVVLLLGVSKVRSVMFFTQSY